MANITLYALRVIATKEFLQYAEGQISPGGGQEVVSFSVPEADYEQEIIFQKYRFNAVTGDLEINGLTYYFLELTNNAILTNPVTGIPQVNVGGVEFFTLTMSKKDIQGNYHTDAADIDAITISISNGDMGVASVSLVAGVGSGDIYAGTVRGTTIMQLEAVDMQAAIFQFETV